MGSCATSMDIKHERGYSDKPSDSCWCFAHRTCGEGRLPTPAAPSPMGPWVARFFGENALTRLCAVPVCNSGLYMSSRQNIHSRARSQYIAIRNALAVSVSPEAGYFMERLVALAYAQPVVQSSSTCGPILNTSLTCK